MVVVIIGASSGIGRALAKELSRRGCKLALIARRRALLEKLNEDLGGDHLVVEADVSRREDCNRAINLAFVHFKQIDTLVYCAGYGWAQPFSRMGHEEVARLVETNLLGTIWSIQAVIPLMKAQSDRDGYTGQIVIVSSACARRGVPYMSVYSLSKAGQLNLTEALRPELAADRIAVTSIHPFTVSETDFFSLIEKRSGYNPKAFVPGVMQDMEFVIWAIRRSIERPCSEVWPKPFSRIMLICSIIFRPITDWVLTRVHCRIFRSDNAILPSQSTGETKVRLRHRLIKRRLVR